MPTEHIELQVVTGSGNYPDSGFREYEDNERLSTILNLAAKHLHLQNTDGWVARIGNRDLNPALSLKDNSIPDRSKIYWAPPAPGGGSNRCIRM